MHVDAGNHPTDELQDLHLSGGTICRRHFHVRGPGWSASIVIASFRVLKGKGPKSDLEEAIKWATDLDHMYRLAAEWRRFDERD